MGGDSKPLRWYPRPDLLMLIREKARRVKNSAGCARQWLNQPCAYLDGRVPIELCADAVSVLKLKEYMSRHARNPMYDPRPSSRNAL